MYYIPLTYPRSRIVPDNREIHQEPPKGNRANVDTSLSSRHHQTRLLGGGRDESMTPCEVLIWPSKRRQGFLTDAGPHLFVVAMARSDGSAFRAAALLINTPECVICGASEALAWRSIKRLLD